MNTNNLNIPLVETSQSQKEVTVNEALVRIDALLNTGAIDRDLTAPPGSPTQGDLYIVASGATGDWAGQDENIAYFDQIWRFITPNEGMALWVRDEDIVYSYNGFDWTPVTNGVGKQTIYIPATQILPYSSNGCSPIATTSLGAGMPDIQQLSFADGSSQFAQFSITMPKRWNNGGGLVTLEWSHPTAAGNFDVVWAVQALAFGQGDSLAASYSTADNVTSTGGASDTIYRATTGFITIFNGPSEVDTLYFRLSREGGDAADTLTTPARLHSVTFEYFSDATTDD